MRITSFLCTVVAAWALFACERAQADDLVWLTGRVFSGGAPLAGATVAVFDQRNRVVDYAETDADGHYTLAAPARELNLNRRQGGFFHQVSRLVGGAGRMVSLPLKAGIRAAASVATATDPLTRVGVGTASNLAVSLVDVISREDPATRRPVRSLPGAIAMRVTAPGHQDAVAVTRTYWVQEEVHRVGGHEQRAIVAWMDPVAMARPYGNEASTFDEGYFLFSDVRLEPGIVRRGQTAILTVRLSAPSEPRAPFVVVARNERTGQMVELQSVGGDRYRAEIQVGPQAPRDEHPITVLAYAEQDAAPGRNPRAEDAIRRAGMWSPKRPYVYNPLLVVSRNRAEATLTVVEPRRR
ncbi:MAG TPA: carboxypeptidase-like regulatory domain-containing protein [Chthonomonadales bacterium]|nr:carboxypeptidase-like regulatory domain-containing protein [Chthonomonadales bacterium]